MTTDSIQYEIFRKGSRTYFTSSLFFPPGMRDDVSVLYAFVRSADDFVDAVPQDKEGFYRFRDNYQRSLRGTKAGSVVIDGFVDLMQRKNFDPEWVDAFFHSMELDLVKSVYATLDETLEYIYGSAEVIGLFMSRIMHLPPEAHDAARMQGRAMQYINFIRDIKEDLEFGRQYLPLEGSGLESLKYEHVCGHSGRFIEFHRKQVKLYEKWQAEAEEGYAYIPARFLVPIKTAAEMYLWTADRIMENPFIVYEKKVKPPKHVIMLKILSNMWSTRKK